MLKPLTFFAVLLAGPVAAQDASTVVATVNDTPITLGQMISMKSGLQDQAAANLPDRALFDLMLDQLIRQTAVAGVGEEQMDAGDQASLENDRRAYFASAALERVAEAEPTEDEINATYQKAFGDTDTPVQYSAAHILVETEEEAKEIKALLDDGGDSARLPKNGPVIPAGRTRASWAGSAPNRWSSLLPMPSPQWKRIRCLIRCNPNSAGI